MNAHCRNFNFIVIILITFTNYFDFKFFKNLLPNRFSISLIIK